MNARDCLMNARGTPTPPFQWALQVLQQSSEYTYQNESLQVKYTENHRNSDSISARQISSSLIQDICESYIAWQQQALGSLSKETHLLIFSIKMLNYDARGTVKHNNNKRINPALTLQGIRVELAGIGGNFCLQWELLCNCLNEPSHYLPEEVLLDHLYHLACIIVGVPCLLNTLFSPIICLNESFQHLFLLLPQQVSSYTSSQCCSNVIFYNYSKKAI